MQTRSGERQRNSWEEDPWEKEYPFEYFKYEVDKDEKIATVTLNNPEGGDAAPFWYIYPGIRLIDKWERDDNVKVVIIKSAGKNFCTGHTLGGYLEHAGKRSVSRKEAAGKKVRPTNRQLIFGMRDGFDFHTRLLCSLKPTIAQVHGMSVAAGWHIQNECDMTIASDDAHFGDIGQVAGVSGILGTPHWGKMPIGRKLFRESASCGRTFSASQAAAMGIINRVVPREKLDEEVWNEARRIAMVPIDGLVTGKYGAMLTLYQSGAIYPDITPFAGHSIKFEDDEFHFFNIAREKEELLAIFKAISLASSM
ncbi:enoyl-CoA hydratase/isomerase family protein, partial [Thermodesulfobacteriota bacterium]